MFRRSFLLFYLMFQCSVDDLMRQGLGHQVAMTKLRSRKRDFLHCFIFMFSNLLHLKYHKNSFSFQKGFYQPLPCGHIRRSPHSMGWQKAYLMLKVLNKKHLLLLASSLPLTDHQLVFFERLKGQVAQQEEYQSLDSLTHSLTR